MTDTVKDVASLMSDGPPRERAKIQVVPLKGLPIAAAAVVFVTLAIAGNWQWALVFCHIAVLFEMNKLVPNGELIGRLMKRFIYTAGITGLMQIATLIIMTRVATQ